MTALTPSEQSLVDLVVDGVKRRQKEMEKAQPAAADLLWRDYVRRNRPTPSKGPEAL